MGSSNDLSLEIFLSAVKLKTSERLSALSSKLQEYTMGLQDSGG